MSKPRVYVIRPKTSWEVVELTQDEEVRVIVLCPSEDKAMAELKELLRENSVDG